VTAKSARTGEMKRWDRSRIRGAEEQVTAYLEVVVHRQRGDVGEAVVAET
jgi:hypothetical protein